MNMAVIEAESVSEAEIVLHNSLLLMMNEEIQIQTGQEHSYMFVSFVSVIRRWPRPFGDRRPTLRFGWA